MEVPMNMQFKKQQCYVAGLALGWIGYAVGLAYFSYEREWALVLLWMAGVPCLRWAPFYFFPHISRFLGYGRIMDKLAPIPPPHANPSAAPVAVNFYRFFSCPLCPSVLARLQALQKCCERDHKSERRLDSLQRNSSRKCDRNAADKFEKRSQPWKRHRGAQHLVDAFRVKSDSGCPSVRSREQ